MFGSLTKQDKSTVSRYLKYKKKTANEKKMKLSHNFDSIMSYR